MMIVFCTGAHYPMFYGGYNAPRTPCPISVVHASETVTMSHHRQRQAKRQTAGGRDTERYKVWCLCREVEDTDSRLSVL